MTTSSAWIPSTTLIPNLAGLSEICDLATRTAALQAAKTWADPDIRSARRWLPQFENSKDEALQVGSLAPADAVLRPCRADQVTRAFRPNLRLSESPGNVLSVYAMSTGELAGAGTPTTEYIRMLMPAGSASELIPSRIGGGWRTLGSAIRAGYDLRQIGLAAYHGPIDHSELTAPMRQLFHWQVARLGGLLVHGAVVGTPRAARS